MEYEIEGDNYTTLGVRKSRQMHGKVADRKGNQRKNQYYSDLCIVKISYKIQLGDEIWGGLLSIRIHWRAMIRKTRREWNNNINNDDDDNLCVKSRPDNNQQ